MARDRNKVIFYHFADEAWNKGNVDIVYETFTEDYHAHAQNPEHDLHSAKAHADFISAFRSSFPDVKVNIKHIVADDDMVMSHMLWEGTHSGTPYMGIPPTGKPVSVAVVGLNRFVGPKIVEAWGIVDTLTMLQQLGVIPS